MSLVFKIFQKRIDLEKEPGIFEAFDPWMLVCGIVALWEKPIEVLVWKLALAFEVRHELFRDNRWNEFSFNPVSELGRESNLLVDRISDLGLATL